MEWIKKPALIYSFKNLFPCPYLTSRRISFGPCPKNVHIAISKPSRKLDMLSYLLNGVLFWFSGKVSKVQIELFSGKVQILFRAVLENLHFLTNGSEFPLWGPSLISLEGPFEIRYRSRGENVWLKDSLPNSQHWQWQDAFSVFQSAVWESDSLPFTVERVVSDLLDLEFAPWSLEGMSWYMCLRGGMEANGTISPKGI